jgi:DNA topoisomerase-1
MMNLVIVESPAKAKTIEGFLGKDFKVMSSYGHIRDLPDKDIAIDVDNGFLPKYIVPAEKKKLISELMSQAAKSEIVWLATDEDREGEAISWHLSEVLKLDPNKTKRIVFHEITKSAINKAIENPRTINRHLVDAQQARRVLDRLVGYEISPVLWRKVKPALSAGRVQSVTVRLIVEREREILNFTSSFAFKVEATFLTANGESFVAQYSVRPEEEREAADVLNALNNAKFEVISVEKKPVQRQPAPPFTTSTLQQEASRKLGFSVQKTMIVAQRLYESGRITYMRTDSPQLSELALQMAADQIRSMHGDAYVYTRQFAAKSKGAQEAHEAIRPTDFSSATITGENDDKRLYELIWKRTVASQMAPAKIDRTLVDIKFSNQFENFRAKGEVMVFDGFIRVYTETTDEDAESEDNAILPPMQQGDILKINDANEVQKFSAHPPRYTEASLVKKLETLGIGRPSTYAPTISTIQKRGYVERADKEGKQREFIKLNWRGGIVDRVVASENYGAEKKKLAPTEIGNVVNDFLVENFAEILDYGFTADVEKEFDDIAEGTKSWNSMIGTFYKPFIKKVEDTLQNSEKAKGERQLGVDPESGKNVYAKIGRFGPMVQIGEATDEDKPKFATLKGELRIASVTLEEALELFKMPKKLGESEGQEVWVGVGRFGPYIRYGKSFISLKDTDPNAIDLAEAIERIKVSIEEKKNAIIKTFPEDKNVEILKGRFGPYIKVGKQNVKIPKGMEPDALTLAECLELAEKSPKKRFVPKKKS